LYISGHVFMNQIYLISIIFIILLPFKVFK
jgi:hypothetical protein